MIGFFHVVFGIGCAGAAIAMAASVFGLRPGKSPLEALRRGFWAVEPAMFTPRGWLAWRIGSTTVVAAVLVVAIATFIW